MRKTSESIALLTISALTISSCAALWGQGQSDSNKQWKGVWTGDGYQFDSSGRWSIKVTISQKNTLIAYPSLKCGGTLTLLKKSIHEMAFKERITYGKKRCLNGGKVVLKLTGPGKANYAWYLSNGEKGAEGKLIRK